MTKIIKFPEIDPALRHERLSIPGSGRFRAVLDTDTYNEIDDQFALAWAMLSPEKLDMRAILAAPFANHRSDGPADGMRKSFDEIVRIFDLLGLSPAGRVFPGAERFIDEPDVPVDSPAARRLVELAHEAARDGEILNVIAIAASTNIASALLMDPEIIKYIRVTWLGGHAFYVGSNREFNLIQDVRAARVLFDSGVPLTLIPCLGMAELLAASLPEIEKRCATSGELGRFLAGRCAEFLHHDPTISKVIWDIATIAYYVIPEACRSGLVNSPRLDDDGSWRTGDAGRHEIRVVTYLERNKIFNALFGALSGSVQPK